MAVSAAAANGIDVASYRAALQKERKLRHFTSMTVQELKDWCLDEGIDCSSFIEKAEYTKALNIGRELAAAGAASRAEASRAEGSLPV